MAKLRATNIDPKTGTNLTLGATGDSVTFASTEIRAIHLKMLVEILCGHPMALEL